MREILPSAFCLLPSAFCLLPSAFCLLPSAFCLLVVRRDARTGGRWRRGGELEAVDFVGEAKLNALLGGKEVVASRIDEVLPPFGVVLARTLSEYVAHQILIVASE